MDQATPETKQVTVNGEELEVVSVPWFHCNINLSLDVELSKRIGKASTTLARLTKKVWKNKHITIPTKMDIYKACVLIANRE